MRHRSRLALTRVLFVFAQRVDAVEAVVGERLAGALDGVTKGYGASWQRPFYFLVLVDLVALVFVGGLMHALCETVRVAPPPPPARPPRPPLSSGAWVSKFRKAALL